MSTSTSRINNNNRNSRRRASTGTSTSPLRITRNSESFMKHVNTKLFVGARTGIELM